MLLAGGVGRVNTDTTTSTHSHTQQTSQNSGSGIRSTNAFKVGDENLVKSSKCIMYISAGSAAPAGSAASELLGALPVLLAESFVGVRSGGGGPLLWAAPGLA